MDRVIEFNGPASLPAEDPLKGEAPETGEPFDGFGYPKRQMRMTALAVLILGLLAQDKALKKLEWKLAPGHAAEFASLDKAGKPLPDQKLIVFGSELTPNSNRIAVDTYEQIPLAMLFQLPPEPIKAASGWEYQTFFFNDAYDALGGFEAIVGGSIRPVCVKGRYLVKSPEEGRRRDRHDRRGLLALSTCARDQVNGQLKLTVTKIELGTLATSAQFSLPRGMLLKAAWQYKVKAQDREGGRIVEKKVETHQLLEFKEDVELDAAKIQPAIETARSAARWTG